MNYGERITDTHIFFYGGIFSQWYPSEFSENAIKFTSAEQYMMYHKAKTFNDHETMYLIMDTDNPKTQKTLGRLVKNYSDEIWASIRYKVVTQGNYLKFTQNEDLFKAILSTDNKIIVEASATDKIWGIGLSPRDNRVLNPSLWEGQNLLGKAIMETRDRIRYENKEFLT